MGQNRKSFFLPPQLCSNQNIITIRKKEILLKTWIIQNVDWFQLQPVGTINNGLQPSPWQSPLCLLMRLSGFGAEKQFSVNVSREVNTKSWQNKTIRYRDTYIHTWIQWQVNIRCDSFVILHNCWFKIRLHQYSLVEKFNSFAISFHGSNLDKSTVYIKDSLFVVYFFKVRSQCWVFLYLFRYSN